MPLSDFLALNFSSQPRVSSNSILIPAASETDNVPATNQQNQRQITVQRISRDARPLLPCEISRYQHLFSTNPTSTRNDANTRRVASDLSAALQNFVPDRQEGLENSRLRSLAQRIPRLNAISATSNRDGQSSSSSANSSGSDTSFRPIPWDRGTQNAEPNAQDFVIHLPMMDVGFQSNRIVNPVPIHSAGQNASGNGRLNAESNNSDLDFN